MEHIDWLHLAQFALFGAAAFYKLSKHQAEHFFTRLVVSLWFGLTVIERGMDVHFVRDVSNYVIILIPIIDLTSPLFLRYWRRTL